MTDEREKKIKEAAQEVFCDFLRCMNILRPDGGERALTTTIKVTNTDRGWGHEILLVMTEKLEGDHEQTVLRTTFTER